MALPANINFCSVTGRFIRAVADGPDVGKEPDGIPIPNLTVVFTSSLNPPVVRNLAESVTIVMDSITCITDENGYLLGPDGSPGVMLVASDDTDLDPHGWTWTASFIGDTFPRISTTFVAPVNGVVDLSTVVPVPANPGTQISQWQAAVTATTTARDEAVAARDEVVALLEGAPTGGGEPVDLSSYVKTDDARLTDTRTPKPHVHVISDITGLQTSLDGKATVIHTHAISDVTNLQAALDGKATTAQGAKADSAVQPAALASYIPLTQKGQPSGIASLGADGKVPTAQLPATSSPVTSVSGKTGDVTLAKGDVGLANVDNTSDAAKPISTAQQAALDSKVPSSRTVAGKALTSDVSLVKSDVGLSNVDNTSDLNKPISTATQTALNSKAPLDAGSKLPIANLPAGSTITVHGDVARPTARTDIIIQWVHSSLPAAFNSNVDIWLNI